MVHARVSVISPTSGGTPNRIGTPLMPIPRETSTGEVGPWQRPPMYFIP